MISDGEFAKTKSLLEIGHHIKITNLFLKEKIQRFDSYQFDTFVQQKVS